MTSTPANPLAETVRLAQPAPAAGPSRGSRVLLALDGGFLVAAGGIQMVLELLGGLVGRGPYARHMYGAPLGIGMFEAHGLALILGLWLILARRERPVVRTHLFAAAVHALLGGANLLWWSSFVTLGTTAAGVVATVVHGLLLVANLVAAARRAPQVLGGPGADFRVAALATLAGGIWLHGTRLALGSETFSAGVFTANVDALLALPMVYATVAGWMSWPRARHRHWFQKVAHGFLLVYLTASVPLHARTVISGSTEHFDAFPDWYGVPALALMIALVVLVAGLRFRPEARVVASGREEPAVVRPAPRPELTRT
jgi:hypothetical protein